MNSTHPHPAVPLWLRLVLVAALLGIAWMSQRPTAAPTTNSPIAAAPPIAAVPSDEAVPTKATVPPDELQPVSVEVMGLGDESAEAASQSDPPPAAPVREAQAAKVAPKASSPEKAKTLVITNLKLKDQTGRVIYQGDIDLQPTLDRIAEGKRLDRFPHDGSVFQNREKRLPKRPSGYYHEYVVPTPKQNGPGPQRLVIGREGETFYTHDHYKSFRRVQ